MIVSRPPGQTLISFGIFLLVTLVVAIMNVMALTHDPAWYTYVILTLLVPIGLFVLYKIFLRYLVIRMGNNQVIIQYPVMRRKYIYPVNEIARWTEHIVKTGKNSVYKELEIRFSDNRKLSFGNREQTEYGRIVSYLNQKAARKKTS